MTSQGKAGGPGKGEAPPDRGAATADVVHDPSVDRARFDRLMEIAGSEGAQELLERLHEDLLRVERGLRSGLADGDLAEVRAQTHVLVALAGAVGATALQHLAEAMNDAAHRGAQDEIDATGAGVLDGLAALARFVAAEEAAGRAPA